MACFKPLTAFRSRHRGSSGKSRITFDRRESNGNQITLACGKCIGCRLDKSQEWAIRLTHEAQCWKQNCFITLTYDEKNYPIDHSLNKKHFQDFMKRLRKAVAPKRIRYFHVGEYGEQLNRPHYHALIFNHDFEDKILWKERDGIKTYISPTLEKTWGKGFCTVGELNEKTTAYCARYTFKKIYGDLADEHYLVCDPLTGESFKVETEYATMSLKPGIGAEWYENFHQEVFPADEVIHGYKPKKPPRYYLKKLEAGEPETFEIVREARLRRANKLKGDNTDERLEVKEYCLKRKVERLRREIEE